MPVLKGLPDVRVLSVRQPWAWLIVNGYKDIENRTWSTKYRGGIIIHASAKKPSADYLAEIRRETKVKIPESFELGGVVGFAELVDCVTESKSRWMQGPIGWKLRQGHPLPFVLLKGKLGLFRLSKVELKGLTKRLPSNLFA
jgi:hypothetical protein